ncbi:flagellar biosynthesis protein FlhB [Azospirillum sp.]|uniref:flagellar biosynthesis protein FlhB n=1 Tax=Azospirillum sp. TaxID=34012 RepID=UPI003D71CE6C
MSEDADDASKTEEPTAKKLEDAHRKGNFPVSREIHNWLMMAAALVLLIAVMPGTAAGLQRRLAFYVEHIHELTIDRGNAGMLLLRAAKDIFWALWLPVLLLMIAGVLGSIAQTGWMVVWEKIVPNLEKISPLAGFKRVFGSINQLVELLKGIAKMAVVGGVAYLALLPMVTSVEHFTGIDVMALLAEMKELTYRLFVGVLGVLTLIAGGDLLWQRHTYNKQMKMTKQEVKDEYKQQEGDPMVKARVRQLRMERTRKRMMANVPHADVVVTNPTHYAVALKYDPESMGAPTVLAKGVDVIALKIREIAKESDVPIVENPPLARALYATVEIDEEIPGEHYRAVAELITYVFKLKGRSVGG